MIALIRVRSKALNKHFELNHFVFEAPVLRSNNSTKRHARQSVAAKFTQTSTLSQRGQISVKCVSS
jgi:hypothetical protein